MATTPIRVAGSAENLGTLKAGKAESRTTGFPAARLC
ncbi:hypothetical protein HY3_14645 [Hyphomonas pacifica]|uniref:Uncharacterized protein n=1 Tax=Hyphomonas pacifica TaxID=1280941 RepID=A0A062TWF8_9PROT|nr:hypothetical protein HY2_14165 [Hyphomonas pacifica]RAN32659.1 hypothetical protein HY3_14645 [Hyphomonas pacifica]